MAQVQEIMAQLWFVAFQEDAEDQGCSKEDHEMEFRGGNQQRGLGIVTTQMTFPEYNQWMDANGRLYTESDHQTYQAICELLPDSMAEPGAIVPSGCQAHNYPAMRMFLDLADPKSMLEIGFNIGRSALFWLREVPDLNLTSLEIRKTKEVLEAEDTVSSEAMELGLEFTLHFTDSGASIDLLRGKLFDAAFIDGDHSWEGVRADINLCLELGIKHILFDDWLPQYGDVMLAVKDEPRLRVVFVAGNMAYCVVKEEGLRSAG